MQQSSKSAKKGLKEFSKPATTMAGSARNEFYVFGEFRLDYEQRQLFRNGTVVPLTPKVVDLLGELVRDSGRVLTKDELLERVWPGVFVEEANLAQNISVLLQVTSRTSSFQFKGKSMDVREIGRRLQVSALIEGSVRNDGDHVRVTAQLIDAHSGRHLWSEAHDGELRDILSLENRVAGAIAVKFNLSAPNLAPPGVGYNGDTEAYRLYLFGRYHWNLQTEESLMKAIGYFEQAIRRSPNYALAYSGLRIPTTAWYGTASEVRTRVTPKRAPPPNVRSCSIRAYLKREPRGL